MDKTLFPSPLSGTIAAIPSKSQAHRLLICAALAGEATELVCRGTSKDIEATKACLRAMGAEIRGSGEGFRVTPGAVKGPCVLPCGESGSTLRFLLPVCAALGLEADFIMEGRLPQRPLAPLDAQLEAHGASLSRPAPGVLRLGGKLRPGSYSLPGDVSSQYISGLLFALPLLDGESRLTVTGRVESAGYISMTLAALGKFGVRAREEEQVYIISPSPYLSPGRVQVEGDWSNAAFWLCAGALAGPVTVTGLDPASLQGDRACLDILRRFGARVSESGDGCTVSPAPLRAVEIDATAIPDLVPVLAVAAAAAKGETRIYNAARLRLKESDRLMTVSAMLTALGGDVRETSDGLIIRGGAPLRGGKTESFGDHRIAMAAAVASAISAGPVTVGGAEAVDKSYPGFWEDLEKLKSKEAAR